MTVLSSGLETVENYNNLYWHHAYNANVDRLNNRLLKISGLLDVDISNLPDGAVLVWDAGQSKWRTQLFPQKS